MHIMIDIGHYASDSGAVGNGFKEVDLNYSIAKYVIEELKRNNIKVSETKGTLAQRVADEKRLRPDYFVSIHNNAGGGDGFEMFSMTSGNGYKLANSIYNQVVNVDKLNNGRGCKNGSHLYVIKNTICPAVLCECAFMDTKDIEAIDTESERKAFGISIAHGILKHLGINPVVKKYQVRAFTFTKIEDAQRVSNSLKELGVYNVIEEMI